MATDMRTTRLSLFALLTACASGGEIPASAAATNGHGGIGIALPDVDGEEVRIDGGGGEVFVLTFWATWCQPCQSELEKLDQIYRERAEHGLRVYAISIDGPDTVAQVAPWARREAYAFPVLLDHETRVLARYNPKGDIPYYVVLDAAGKVLKSHQGYVEGDMDALALFLDQVLTVERAQGAATRAG